MANSTEAAGGKATPATREPSEHEAGSPVLEVRSAWKSFGHVTALAGASIHAAAGQVVAIVGDNGAGKSTLVKVLAGVYALDDGEVLVHGRPVLSADPAATRAQGISTVFQDLALVEALDVAANMFLGNQLKRFGILADRHRMIEEASTTIQALRVQLPSVRVPVGILSGGQRQGLAIARAVREDNPIILMDEPTAALGIRETAQILHILRELRQRGNSVILVSHDLEFVLDIADVIYVMRLGTVRARRERDAFDRSELVAMITGVSPGDGQGSESGGVK